MLEDADAVDENVLISRSVHVPFAYNKAFGPLHIITSVIVILASDLGVLHELAHAEAALDARERDAYDGDTLAGLFPIAHFG
ncbi:hypothetical protein FALCPG4_016745 [Fusarium falciforme]